MALSFTVVFPGADTLEINVNDVEGGNAVIVLNPSGQSILIDGGMPGQNDRDLKRVVAAAQAADAYVAFLPGKKRVSVKPGAGKPNAAWPAALPEAIRGDDNAAWRIRTRPRSSTGSRPRSSARRDGSFTVTNTRNNFSKTYRP
jgi:hypothetical protein